MTPRAIVAGLLVVAGLSGLCYFNDMVLRQSYLVGSYLPIPIMGGMLLLILLVNPLLGRLGRGWAWTGAEQAMVLAIVLAACWVPGRGLMHYFTTLQMLPHHYAKLYPGWQKTDILATIPARMLADPTVNGGKALGDYIQGTKVDNPDAGLADLPWAAWLPSLGFWVPLFMTMAAALLGLALVVHRQWSEHEHLAYPICNFANALFSQEDGRASPIFRNAGFWLGMAGVLGIHLYNYAGRWWPEYLLAFPLSFDFRSLLVFFPTLNQGGAGQLFYPTLFFTVIGFAYFLPSEVSLSLGVAGFFFCWVVGLLGGYGIVVTGQHLSLRLESFMHGGALFAMLLVLVYTGRHYYLQVARQALGVGGSGAGTPRSAIWGMRLFWLGSAAFAGQLAVVGLEWPLAILYTLGTVAIFLVTSRVVAEAGVFYIHPWVYPCSLIWGLLGSQALGPQAMLIMMLVSSLLLIDPREAFMPFIVHALKLAEGRRLPLGRVGAWGLVSLGLAFGVAVPMTLYWQYREGIFSASDGWSSGAIPTMAIHHVVGVTQRLEATEMLVAARELSSLGRFVEARPQLACWIAFGATMGATLLCAFARLRLARWPLHPVLFIVLGTWQSQSLGPSFLLGWLIKGGINRYGGAVLYHQLKPLMIGLVAGEMLGGVVPLLIGMVYYAITGEPPKVFWVFRG